MIVSPSEYNSLKYRFTDPNKFSSMFRLPTEEEVYEIDLNARSVKAPKFVSVESDHDAEIIWFITDRFYENFDLNDATVWIQYRNANKKEYFYQAPTIVGLDNFGSHKILIPWMISQSTSIKSGSLEFGFQFFKIRNTEGENGQAVPVFDFILNTQSAKTTVLSNGNLYIDPSKDIEIYGEVDAVTADYIRKLSNDYDTLSSNYELYWIEVN